MKILNLYCGIGGNRKLWGDDHQITAVEIVPEIAQIYQDFFPNDRIVIGDAHQYLLEHYGEFDFIWSSPPCPTHSKINIANHISPYKDNTAQIKHGGGIPPRFPDLKLYEEIIFLKHYVKREWCVENVIGYYAPLILPKIIQRHYFWCSFDISDIGISSDKINKDGDKMRSELLGFNLSKYKISQRKDTILRNCVRPELGKHILDCAMRKQNYTSKQEVLFLG